jgi:starch synthase (maltosyl-transferring)
MAVTKYVPLVYNLFPRHFSAIDEWKECVDHMAAMKFNTVFVNPFHETGFSGSLYAVKDYYRLNPYFLRPGQDPADWSPLAEFVQDCARKNMRIAMDLVINHTARDSVLVESHPEWYRRDGEGNVISPFAIDPADENKVTVWGDLAIIDNAESPGREALWRYWDELVRFFQDLGISIFRCDAAYQVPAELWAELTAHAKKRNPDTLFLAETLGCRLEEVEALAQAGFDYLFNSSMWWRFDEPWCLEQHEENRTIAPSISFPESHDTERQATEPPGDENNQKARYLFAALFSKGLLMPMGYEYGATTRMDVVKGAVGDREPTKGWNLTQWIGEVNEMKCSVPLLMEGHWEALTDLANDMLMLKRSSDDGDQSLLVCINKDRQARHSLGDMPNMNELVDKYPILIRPMSDVRLRESVSGDASLDSGEIVLLMAK